MTQPAEATAVQPTKDEAYTRLAKSVLRRRAVDQMVNAIKRDMAILPKGNALAARSERVLKYMRGYIAAVESEQEEALLDYETAVIHAAESNKLIKKGRSSLGRVRRNGETAANAAV